jgi:hypothetical protein
MEAVLNRKIKEFNKMFDEKVKDIDEISKILLFKQNKEIAGKFNKVEVRLDKEAFIKKSYIIDNKLYSMENKLVQEKDQLHKIKKDSGNIEFNLI